MALRFIDSCDHYQTAQITAKWTAVSQAGFFTINNGVGRCGTNCLSSPSGGGVTLTKGIPFSGLTGVAGYAIKFVSQRFTELRFFSFGSGVGSGTNIYLVRVDDGSVRVYRNDAIVANLGTSAPDLLRIGEWYFLECKLFTDGAVGTVEVRINGIAVLTIGPVDTIADGSGAALTSIIFHTGQSAEFLVDDLYVLDDSGGAPANDYLGDVRVEYLEPTAAGFHQDWALVGAASHWQAVDDGATPDGDTSYIHTATVGQIDTEVYENTGLPLGTIFGVQLNLYARKTDSGFREVAPMIRHAGTDYSGASQAPSFASYNYLIELFALNPGTGLAWTIADVNAAEFGVRLSV